MPPNANKKSDIRPRRLGDAPPRPPENRLARERLAEIEAFYNTAPVGLCVLDAGLRYVRINERLAEINRLPVADHIGRTMREILPELADQAEPWLLDVLETGEALRDVEITIETHDEEKGERTRVENWYPMTDADGHVYGINIVYQFSTRVRSPFSPSCVSTVISTSRSASPVSSKSSSHGSAWSASSGKISRIVRPM